MSESGEDAEAEYLRLKEAYDALHNKKKKQDSPEQFESTYLSDNSYSTEYPQEGEVKNELPTINISALDTNQTHLEYERLKAMHKVDGAITVNTTFHSNPPEHTLTTNQEQQQQPDQYEETTDEDDIESEYRKLMESHNKLQQKAIAKKEIAAAEANVWDNLTDGVGQWENSERKPERLSNSPSTVRTSGHTQKSNDAKYNSNDSRPEFILVTPNKRKISNSPKKPIGRDRPIVAPQIDVTLENEMMTPPKPFNPPLHDMMTTYDIEAQLQKKMEEYNQMVILDEQLLFGSETPVQSQQPPVEKIENRTRRKGPALPKLGPALAAAQSVSSSNMSAKMSPRDEDVSPSSSFSPRVLQMGSARQANSLSSDTSGPTLNRTSSPDYSKSQQSSSLGDSRPAFGKKPSQLANFSQINQENSISNNVQKPENISPRKPLVIGRQSSNKSNTFISHENETANNDVPLTSSPRIIGNRPSTKANNAQPLQDSPSSGRQNFPFSHLEKRDTKPLLEVDKKNEAVCGPVVWVPDKEVTNCKFCDKEFSAFTRKHHCRNCGQVFCSSCSSKQAKLPEALGYEGNPQRVCEPCYFKLTS